MAHGNNYSGLLLPIGVVVILLALECSAANCHGGRERKWLSWSRTIVEEADAKLMFEGRKMLQGLGEPVKARTGAHRLNTKNKDEMLKQNENVHDHSSSIAAKGNNHESKEFLEAADEVANLMRKDYRGAPRRKPPINNSEPKD